MHDLFTLASIMNSASGGANACSDQTTQFRYSVPCERGVLAASPSDSPRGLRPYSPRIVFSQNPHDVSAGKAEGALKKEDSLCCVPQIGSSTSAWPNGLNHSQQSGPTPHSAKYPGNATLTVGVIRSRFVWVEHDPCRNHLVPISRAQFAACHSQYF
jgi:hypothetical protein